MNDRLLRAIQTQNPIQVHSLIHSGLLNLNAPLADQDASPAVVLAARCDALVIVEMLLNAGARINSADNRGMTACHAAADKPELLKLLLARGPDLRLEYLGNTPLDYAVQMGQKQYVVLLIEAAAPLTNPHSVCHAAAMSTAAIQALLNRGVVIGELRDSNGYTPLHWTGNAAAANVLVNVCNVDLDARDRFGRTPCHHAATLSSDSILRLLLEAGADIEAANGLGETPLHRACEDGTLQSIATLLAYGANVHARSQDGWTACHFATVFDDEYGVRDISPLHLLLAAGAGADLDVADSRGRGRIVRQLLLERGLVVDLAEVELARRRIAKLRLDVVRHRALQVCIGLQSRGLDALQTCEILQFACGPLAPLIRFHQWWAIATTVKHFER